jgi:hypothetical protein|tara:strand:+ start:377 stop:643 length:267 start_codon:yes stop_codon:yes gene_type:complete
MGKLIFTYTDKDFIENNREVSKIEFDVPDDMNIHEYKVICVRLASAIGYGDKTIKKSFGDLIYGDDDTNELKELLHELNITKTTNKKT